MDFLAGALRDSVKSAAAFEPLFRDRLDPLINRLVRRVYDSEVAVDIAAETLAEVFIQRKRFRGSTDGEVVAWINGIADRKLALFYRKHEVESRALRKLGLESPDLTEEEHHQVLERSGMTALRELIRTELEALSQEQRAVVTLRLVEERPYPEIASELGITEQAARARVARALKSLRGAVRAQALAEESS